MNKILIIGSSWFSNITSGYVTKEIVPKISIEKTHAGMTVINCSGFGDSKLFSIEFLKFKEKILELAPIDALVFVIDFNDESSNHFLQLSRQLTCLFGYEAIKSMMLLCIEGDVKIRNGLEDFEDKMVNSFGYQYLKRENENQDIPYCLWHNIRPYYNQSENFINCFTKLQKMNKKNLECTLELMEKEIDFGIVKKKMNEII